MQVAVLGKIRGSELKIGANYTGYHVFDPGSGILLSGRTRRILEEKIFNSILESEPRDDDA